MVVEVEELAEFHTLAATLAAVREPPSNSSIRVRPQKVVHGVHLFLSHLRDAGKINLPWAPNHDPALLSAFCQWMHQQRGISDVTLSTYSIYIRELLRRIG